MKKLRVSLLASAILVFGSAAGLVRADIILAPTATDNDHYSVGAPDGVGASASKTVDGSGLSNASLVADGVSVPVIWPTNDVSGDSPAFWNGFAAFYGTNVVTYAFATSVNISGGHFWQYGGDTPGRSLKTADIYVSANGTDYTSAGTLAGYEQLAVGTQDPGADFSLTATGVRYVQLQNVTPYDTGTGFVGFGEIRFVGTVPEPGTLALVATGVLGMLAYAWRKRR